MTTLFRVASVASQPHLKGSPLPVLTPKGGTTNLKVGGRVNALEGGGRVNTVKTLKFEKGGELVHDPPPAPIVAPLLTSLVCRRPLSHNCFIHFHVGLGCKPSKLIRSVI